MSLRSHTTLLLGIVFWSILILSSCTEKRTEEVVADPNIIASYTSGIRSCEGSIKVRFINDIVDSASLATPLKRSPFKIKPSIVGVALWSDCRTLEFRPDDRLPAGKDYSVIVHLSNFVETDVGKDKFTFSFSTMKQSFEVFVDGLQAIDNKNLKLQQLNGRIVTADVEEGETIAKLLKAQQEKRSLEINWAHSEDRRTHTFTIGGVERGEAVSLVQLSYNGASISVDDKGSIEIPVPSINSFAISDIRPIQKETQYIEIRFTDPLKKKQNLRGLIQVNRRSNFRFAIERNILRVYTSGRWGGQVTVKVEPGIRNSMNMRLTKGKSHTISFDEAKPKVQFIGKGVILPTTQGLTIPIKAINLRAVIVEVTQIFEKNIPQFLQVNELNESSEMSRVGRVVWKKVVPLNFTQDKTNQWVNYGLDLGSLLEEHKQGIYQIKLSFKRRHVVYHCGDEGDELAQGDDDLAFNNAEDQTEASFWDFWENNAEHDWHDFYQNRKNPCHPAYYKDYYYDSKITVTRNVLVSDIGIIAKKGTNDDLLLVTTDLQTAKPLSSVQLTVMDYQQTVLATGKSDNQGLATVKVERTPFIVVAEHANQKGYLRLADGAALSESHFDVSGDVVKKGLKGFIYGERGVWRPGDSLFLTFILKDSENKIPKNHPVIFELRNPKGQLVKVLKKFQSLNGFYCFRLATNEDAPTGNWNVKIKIGGVTFDKRLKIETVRPNRLKINIGFGKDVTKLSNGIIHAELSSTWLHGAIAKELKSDVEVAFSPMKTSFKKYKTYTFDDPVRKYQSEKEPVFEGNLDDKGKRSFSFNLLTKNLSPGMLKAKFTTRVFEPGGAFSTDRFSIPYHPYSRYIGMLVPKGDKVRGMLLTDTTHTVSIVALDVDGKPLPDGTVDVEMYKIKWRWWWAKGEESLAQYEGSSSFRPIKKEIVSIVNGKGTWQFKLKYPEWGRYLIRVKDRVGSHCTGKIVYIDWPGWAGRAKKDDLGGAQILSFSSNKEEYKVGEEITLTIPTGKRGRGLVSIETGSKILKTDWITASEKPTKYSFRATEAMAPNIYAHVTFLQPHLQAGNDLPIRLYGVVPIKVVDPETVLKPVIHCAKVFKPSQSTTIKVSEANRKKMTYTLAIVDEGLLDLTRFKTPNPWPHFYKREAHGVKTWDIYDFVAGAYSGELERLLAIGGGENVIDKGKKKANRFPPMVKFMGPFKLRKGKTNSHTVAIPQYIGSVRVMVVAGQDLAYGKEEKAVFVRKPLMILGTLPRVLGPEEKVSLPISVFAMEKKVKKVTVSVSTNNLVTVDGAAKQSISFPEVGDELITFTLKTGAQTGIAKVSIVASGGGEKITQEIELDVRPSTWPVVDVFEGTIAPKEKWKQSIPFPGVAGTNEALLEVSRIPPLNLGRRLNFLIRYPHGCVEQTTSAAFPQLYLRKLLDLSPEKSKEIQKNMNAGINRLRTYQNLNGGFGYWPGARESNEWCTNYVGHFLVEAQRVGYSIPPGMLDQWKNYQKKMARSWITGSDHAELIQAYRLYTLALANDPALGAMNRLKEKKGVPDIAKWRLAAAYQLAGQKAAAKQVIKGCKTTVKKYRELSNTYGSDLRDLAMILETLSLLDMKKKAQPLVNSLSKELCSKKWLSTQSTAYILIAMARHAGITTGDGSIAFEYTWNGATKKRVNSKHAIVQEVLKTGSNTEGVIHLINNGESTLYPRIVLEGTPAPGTEVKSENGMILTVDFETLKGKELTPDEIEQGTDFVAEITVKHAGNTGDYEEVALSHIFPSGWEIHNERMASDNASQSKDFEYQDIRDDRVYTYFDLRQDELKEFKVLLNASYLGKFYLPMVNVETMYDETINARIPGKWITVVETAE